MVKEGNRKGLWAFKQPVVIQPTPVELPKEEIKPVSEVVSIPATVEEKKNELVQKDPQAKAVEATAPAPLQSADRKDTTGTQTEPQTDRKSETKKRTVTSIGQSTFESCNNLILAYFNGSSIPSMTSSTFQGIPNPTSIAYYKYGTTQSSLNTFISYGFFTYYVASVSSQPCFKEGTRILTKEGYKPVESLRKGDLIQTLKHGFLPVHIIGKGIIEHNTEKERIKGQLYQCSKSFYPELVEDLIITGCHSILVDWLTQEQGEKIMEECKCIYETDGKPRLMAYLDNRATVYETPGTYTIYHLALEHENETMNYGIYANGLLVESSSIRTLRYLFNMVLIE
jgi:hypothetical protein